MTRWTHFALAACVATATVACADRATDSSRAGTDGAVGTSGTPAARDAARNAAAGDREFVGGMLSDGHAEVELGKMAQNKAASKAVKDFAAMMVRDHTKAGHELKTVASTAKIDMTAEHDMDRAKDVRERLSKLSGREFDREYMQVMIDDHEKAVDRAEDKAERADSDHVKQWAAKTLPTLKKHLEEARQIHANLDKRGN